MYIHRENTTTIKEITRGERMFSTVICHRIFCQLQRTENDEVIM